MNTREMASWVIQHKGLDGDDRYLRTAIALGVQAPTMQAKRGAGVERAGKVSNVVLWRAPHAAVGKV